MIFFFWWREECRKNAQYQGFVTFDSINNFCNQAKNWLGVYLMLNTRMFGRGFHESYPVQHRSALTVPFLELWGSDCVSSWYTTTLSPTFSPCRNTDELLFQKESHVPDSSLCGHTKWLTQHEPNHPEKRSHFADLYLPTEDKNESVTLEKPLNILIPNSLPCLSE